MGSLLKHELYLENNEENRKPTSRTRNQQLSRARTKWTGSLYQAVELSAMQTSPQGSSTLSVPPATALLRNASHHASSKSSSPSSANHSPPTTIDTTPNKSEGETIQPRPRFMFCLTISKVPLSPTPRETPSPSHSLAGTLPAMISACSEMWCWGWWLPANSGWCKVHNTRACFDMVCWQMGVLSYAGIRD